MAPATETDHRIPNDTAKEGGCINEERLVGLFDAIDQRCCLGQTQNLDGDAAEQ